MKSGKVVVKAYAGGVVLPIDDPEAWICKFWRTRLFGTLKPKVGKYEINFIVKKLSEKKK